MQVPKTAIILFEILKTLSFSRGDSIGLQIPWNESCTGLIQDIQYETGAERDSDRSLLCEVESGEVYTVNVSKTWIEEHSFDGSLVSGETKVDFPYGSVVDDSHQLIEMAGTPILSSAPRNGSLFRRLSPYAEGSVSILIVRVVAPNGSTSKSIDELTNSILGNVSNDPDLVTLKSQYRDCSHGKLEFVQAPDRDGISTEIRKGGTTISIDTRTTEGHSAMRNAITKELNYQFKVTKPDELAMHVMYCLPPDTLSGVAYATVNSWNSVYNDDWCVKLSAQVHEIGHNLGLAHSNERGAYKDQSGMMGYSYREDNSPKMCFNAAKSWQIGWYKSRHEIVNRLNPSYIGELTSIVDDLGSNGPPMIIKLENQSGGKDYYINFNLKASFNAGTKKGGDQVLVIEAGSGYAESELKAKLNENEEYEIDNFFVEVLSINTSNRAAFVRICLGSCPNEVTIKPTPNPTIQPVPSPSYESPSVAPTFQTYLPTKNFEMSGTPTQDPTLLYARPTLAPLSSRPTMDPTNLKSPRTLCYDEVRKIPILNQARSRNCKWIGRDLNRCMLRSAEDSSKLLSDLCPVTCRMDCKCYDIDVLKYRFSGGQIREVDCDWVASQGLCRSNEGRSYCPIVCGIC